VQYEGVREEHMAVRESCASSTSATWARIETSGAGALELLQRLLSNDVAKIQIGAPVQRPLPQRTEACSTTSSPTGWTPSAT